MTLKELQDILFGILCEIDTVCKKEEIPYMLIGGTAIGAVRHKDFIPWDDDIDIGVWDKDYPRLEEALIKLLPAHLKVTRPEELFPNFYDFVVRVQDTRYNWHDSTAEDEAYDNKQNYVCVDIFFLSNSGNTTLQKKIFDIKQTIIYCLARGHRIGESQIKTSGIKRLILDAAAWFGKKIPMKKIMKWQNKWYEHNIKLDTTFCAFPNTAPQEFGFHYKSEWFKGQTFVPFRDKEFPMPIGFHEFLTTCYGDYMKPPEDKSIYIQHFVEKDSINA